MHNLPYYRAAAFNWLNNETSSNHKIAAIFIPFIWYNHLYLKLHQRSNETWHDVYVRLIEYCNQNKLFQELKWKWQLRSQKYFFVLKKFNFERCKFIPISSPCSAFKIHTKSIWQMNQMRCEEINYERITTGGFEEAFNGTSDSKFQPHKRRLSYHVLIHTNLFN